MRLFTLLFLSVLTLSCAPERVTSIIDRAGEPGRDDVPRKLRKARQDSVVMAKAGLSRLGEIDGIAKILLLNPKDRKHRTSCPAVSEPIRTEGNTLFFGINWESCDGEFHISDRYGSPMSVSAEYQNDQLLRATVTLTPRSQPKYKETDSLAYDLVDQTILFAYSETTNGTQQFSVRLEPFQLTRVATAFEQKWEIANIQSLFAVLHYRPETKTPEPNPAKLTYSGIELEMTLLQTNLEGQTDTEDRFTATMREQRSAELNLCGYPMASFQVSMKAAAIKEPLPIQTPIVITEKTLQDPYGDSVAIAGCLKDGGSLTFVKENMQALFAYKITN